MVSTRFTTLVGIRCPIVQAGMTWATGAELVAAVSNAGGLGHIGPNADQQDITSDVEETAERLRMVIRRTRSLTDKPFIVNIPIGWMSDRSYSDASVNICIEERVPIVTTAAGSPEVYTRRLKQAGMLVFHAVSTSAHARKAESCGVDVVIAESHEGGGLSGNDEIPLTAIVPQVRDSVAIPVLAGGGLADGRGLLAALALGADGAYMGTRFMASIECPIHDAVKQAIVAARETDTVTWGTSSRVGSSRGLRNAHIEEVRALETTSASPQEVIAFSSHHPVHGSRSYAVLKLGRLEEGVVPMGTGSAIIQHIKPAAVIVEEIMQEAERGLRALCDKWSDRCEQTIIGG